jgi:hypothetical protein
VNDNGELDDEALRDVNVDVVVAWWLNACLQGDMTVEHLLGALRSLDADLKSAPSDCRRRLASLEHEVQAVLTSGNTDLARVESAAVAFLGSHPARVLGAASPPDWYMQK